MLDNIDDYLEMFEEFADFDYEDFDDLQKSLFYLINSLKNEGDSRLQEVLAIMLNVNDERRKCDCGNRHDRICDRCEETLLCDDCDEGTFHDECSVCHSCKLSDEESRAAYYDRWG